MIVFQQRDAYQVVINYIKNGLDNDVRKILNLDTKLRGKGNEKLLFHTTYMISKQD